MTKRGTVLDGFGKFLMINLRDRAIGFHDALERGEWRAPSLRMLQRRFRTLTVSQRAIVRRALVEAVDHAIHDFLFQVQEVADNSIRGGVEVRVKGRNVAELSDGLHGEPFGRGGWQARFSAYGSPSSRS